MIKRTNVESQLQRSQSSLMDSSDILNQVKDILDKETDQELRINSELGSGFSGYSNAFDFDLLETHNIYHLSTIKDICVDYRLRFLDTKYFKGEIPNEAINKIKLLEKNHEIQLKGFKIIAPSKLFKLKKADDPLLFAPIGNDYYYLIHTWGNDLSPLRKWLMLPFRNFETLAFTTLIVSFLATFLVPNGMFSKETSASEFWMLFFFMFKSIAAIVIFYGFALGKNFNTAIWDCTYNKA
ncbi:MAG: hypothetical protein KJP09_05840 [Bacteroidia bacterium]|nr:hypothetical protein [Bacteroidia bacterium]MBT8308918.1 hypothetical protein [Bacteroidia bacterium]NNK26788.1 hypothetical protein [Flavobacteriaceae bacterium]NNL60879.1 hypothetical protein [Flavobacteriaceae bacterium]